MGQMTVQPLTGRHQPDLQRGAGVRRRCMSTLFLGCPIGAGQLGETFRAGRQQRVDLRVFVFHRLHGGQGLCVMCCGDSLQQHRPDLGVLRGVVLVQHGREELPASGEQPPGPVVRGRGRGRRGDEIPQVTAKGVVDDVHRRHVDRAVRSGRLTGQHDLRSRLGRHGALLDARREQVGASVPSPTRAALRSDWSRASPRS
jgi:hypothetical protein